MCHGGRKRTTPRNLRLLFYLRMRYHHSTGRGDYNPPKKPPIIRADLAMSRSNKTEEHRGLHSAAGLLALQRQFISDLNAAPSLNAAFDVFMAATSASANLQSGGLYLKSRACGDFKIAVHKNLPSEHLQKGCCVRAGSRQWRMIHERHGSFSDDGICCNETERGSRLSTTGASRIFPLWDSSDVTGFIHLLTEDHCAVPFLVWEVLEILAERFAVHISRLAGTASAGRSEGSRSHTDELLPRESELLYKTLIDSSLDLIFVVDRDLRVIYGNPRAMQSFSIRPDAIIGKHVSALFSPSITQPHMEHLSKVVQTGKKHSIVTESSASEGAAWFHTTFVPIIGNRDEVISVMGFVRDVTSQKKAEMKLGNCEEKYRKLVDDISDGVFHTDLAGRIVYANNSMAAIHGYTQPDEMMGVDFLKLIRDDFKETVQESFSQGSQTGLFQRNMQVPVLNREKNDYFFASIDAHLINEGDEVAGIGGIIRDISAVMNAERKIAQSEEKHRAVFESATDAFIIADFNGAIVEVNPSACSLYGYSKEEMVRLHAVDIIHPDSQHKLPEFIQQISENGHYVGETVDRRKDGTTFHTEVHGSLIVLNNIPHLLAVVRDVSTQKEAEEKLRQSEEKFKTLFHSVSIPLCYVREDGTVESFNDRFTQLLGYTKEDIPSLDEWWNLAYPDEEYRAWVVANWNTAVEKSIELGIDITSDTYNVTCKNGEVREIIIAGITVGTDFLATLLDVTEQRRAEENILREKEFSDSVLDAMPGIFYLFNQRGTFVRWNRTLSQLSGFSYEEIAQKSPLDFIAPHDRETISEAIQTAFMEGEVYVEGDFLSLEKREVPFYFTGIRVEFNGEPHLLGVGIDITERIRAEKALAESRVAYLDALKRSEEKFKALLTHSPVPHILASLDGRVEFVNNSFVEIVGYTANDVADIDEWWLAAYPDPVYREEMKQTWQVAMAEAEAKGGATVPVEAKIRCKNGTDRIFSVVGSLIGGQVLVLLNDLTERIQAQEERDRFFKVSLDLLCIAGPDGYFKQMNPAWHKILGWSVDELKARPFFDFIHPDDVKATRSVMESLAQGEPVVEFTNRYRCKNESFKWINWNVVPFGEFLYASATDVTELKEAKEQLTELYGRLDLALKGGNVGIWEWDLQTNLTLWDERMERMFGLEPGAFDGTYEGFLQRLHPEDVEETRRAVVEVLEGKKTYDIIYRSLSEEGVRFINAKAVLLKNERLENVRMIGVCTDVTAIKEAEQRIKKIAEDLKRSNEDLEQFAYVASHDLQEPLRMVASFTQLLEKRYRDQIDETANKYIHYAVDGAARMQQLINDLLSFSRISTHGVNFQMISSSLIVEAAIESMAVLIHESKAYISFADLPDIRADKTQIQRLFMNLIGNSIKFCRDDVPPRISISGEDQGGHWLFSVRDNGIGISAEYSEKIFIIFQRLHGKEEYPGTGIGLSLCKRIVSRHGGEIWFESKPYEGTTFFFTLFKNCM